MNGKTFNMYKFRSMCVDAEEKLAELQELNEKTGPVFKIADDPRITRVGKWIRKLSIDEMPQFFNTLKWKAIRKAQSGCYSNSVILSCLLSAFSITHFTVSVSVGSPLRYHAFRGRVTSAAFRRLFNSRMRATKESMILWA